MTMQCILSGFSSKKEVSEFAILVNNDHRGMGIGEKDVPSNLEKQVCLCWF